MICKQYFALKDSLGYPIPGTMQGFNIDPCKCELVELKAVPDEPGDIDIRQYHPQGLHYYYLLDKDCKVVPNSLVISKKRPKGRYIEFIQYVTPYSTSRTGEFSKDDCSVTESTDPVSFTKVYTSTISQADAEAKADANFPIDGQAYANEVGICVEIP